MGSETDTEPTGPTPTASEHPNSPQLSPATPIPKQAKTFLDLPPETQKEIVSHCSQSDLICLALVSRHFRELAASQLYRNFHIVFPDDDDPSFDSPIDGLAGGLDTFVTSEYNYAMHLRDISLDTLSAGSKAETAYKPYLYNLSCGKFMNTLLLLTLKKAHSLESFRWNIRVELSRQVYKALHQIKSLSNLHIRMQAGPSLYEIPPPLPYHMPHTPSIWADPTASALPASTTSGLPPPPAIAPLSIFGTPTPYFTTAITPAAAPVEVDPLPIAPRHAGKVRPARKLPQSKEPPTISGFKSLKSLSVLDIDNLEVVPEIQGCVRNSSSTLTKLKISFSDCLAAQARKPPPDSDPNADSDDDDEFQMAPVVQGNQHIPDDATGPAKAYRAQQMRKTQEAVLGRILDVEPHHAIRRSPQCKATSAGTAPDASGSANSASADPSKAFIDSIKEVGNKLMTKLNREGQADLLDLLEKAAKKYVESEKAKPSENPGDGEAEPTPSDEAGASGSGDQSSSETEGSSWEMTNGESSNSEISAAAPESTKNNAKVSNPEDIINIEEPEESQLNLDLGSDTKDADAEESTSTRPGSPAKDDSRPTSAAVANGDDTISSPTSRTAKLKTLRTQLQTLKEQEKKWRDDLTQMSSTDNVERLEEAEAELKNVREKRDKTQDEIDILEDKQDDIKQPAPKADPEKTDMAEYIRQTRGLGLSSLGLHLIPIKASVLTKAVDFRSLKRLTLLNVGNQAPLWIRLAEENAISPLPLRKIFTDNVSNQFLTFVSQLEAVHELFLLERGPKYKPESFAPKTSVKMEDIRKFILKRHLKTLKRLMIKHEGENDHEHHPERTQAWDADEKATLLICRKGKKLEELSISMGIKAVHTLVQHIGELTNLRALHIQKFRNEDTCVWVMRETRRFIRDNLTHYPGSKLEWLCIDDDRVDRIVRPLPRIKKAKSEKGKEPEGPGCHGPGAYPVLPTDNLDDNSETESEGDDLDIQDLKLELIDNIHFYDIWGVRIFKKEVMAGRL